ncbi:cilium assembly protein DZIP1L isoform X4 [Grus americana]|uniref:cilium assembly protein DZIP1L isoform X4 n=1 Tax=Grus americana TaxID=9117 RepID=UPI0024089258|nr:cilium assembly protein DZIP1L isoform X4 [Grus americana]
MSLLGSRLENPAAPCSCSALPMPPSPRVPGRAEPWRNTSGSLGASCLQTTFGGLKLGQKKLIWAPLLLQTGSDNCCPPSSELAEESPGKLGFSCTTHAVTQRLPGLPDPVLSSSRERRSMREAEACAGRWAGRDWRYHCTRHTQQHANTALAAPLRVPGHSACAGTPSASETMPFSVDFYHPPHQPMPAGMPGASPGLTIPVDIPPFHFQPRRVGVDWRRFGAIDVERVAREVDVAALQDHIASVTFCNLDGERCPHCGQPADPVLLKVLRMAQLSIEYLLHCQERLGTSLAAHAQRLQAARAELACAQQQAAEQATQLRGAKEESRRWKKLIATQQLLLQAGPDTYCKCHLCGKAFTSDSFLRAHVQRRHAEATEAERQKMKQVEQMEDEVEELKAKLREMQQQLEVEREAEKLRREQEMERARQQEEDGRRDLERWKEEERTKLHEEIDGLRQLFLAAFKDVASRSSAVEGVSQHPAGSSGQARGCPSLLPHPIQIKLLSASKPEVTQEVTKRVAVEESSDREEAALGGKQRLMEALQRNPNLLKQFRPILEEVLEEKLESMGVKRVVKGISTRTYRSLQALVRLQQQEKAEKFPGLLHLRDELVQALMGKVRRRKKPSTNLPQQVFIIPARSPKSPRSLRRSQPTAIPAAAKPEASLIPQPAPRSRARSTHSPPGTPWGTLRTSKASSPHRGLVPWQRDSHIHDGDALGEMPGCSGTETTRWGETLPSPELSITQNQPARQETPGIS